MKVSFADLGQFDGAEGIMSGYVFPPCPYVRSATERKNIV